MTEIDPLLDSPRPFRHMVRLYGDGWLCVDCGLWFEDWPPDSVECPAHAE